MGGDICGEIVFVNLYVQTSDVKRQSASLALRKLYRGKTKIEFYTRYYFVLKIIRF